MQVGEIGTSRSGLGAAYVKCPVAGARKLAQAGKVALGWSTARVTAISKRPFQCYKCLELGHVRATCVSTARASVQQVRRKRIPCKRMSRIRTQIPPVRIVRGTR
jgi:hypothetical protein